MANEASAPVVPPATGVPRIAPQASPRAPLLPPFPVLSIVPWLMLATAMRFVGWRGGWLGLGTTVVADLCVFMAFLIGAHAVVAWSGGQLRIGSAGLRAQLSLGHRVLLRILLLLVSMTVLVSIVAPRGVGPHMMMGFDGIAFDQFSRVGMLWSGVLAAILLLMVAMAETTGRVSLLASLRELVRRAGWMLPAIAAVALMQLGLSPLQGAVRGVIYAMWQTALPETLKNFAYFGFVLGFATLRLWATLLILVVALRQSSRQSRRAGAAGAQGTLSARE